MRPREHQAVRYLHALARWRNPPQSRQPPHHQGVHSGSAEAAARPLDGHVRSERLGRDETARQE
eukprot:785380-Alexandrium_andersonii.AAC.1